MLKMVEDRLAKKVYTVNDEKAMLLSYNNRNRRIVRSAEIYEKGEPTGEYATYVEEGTIDTVRERLSAWDNALKMIYAQSVEFNAAENDPDNSKYEAFVRSIEEHEDKYFDEYGDLITSWTLNLEALKAAGLYTDEVLLPMGYIPLSEYCKKHGYDMRNVRRKLAEGKMNGIKQANCWFLPEDEPYYTRMLNVDSWEKWEALREDNEKIIVAVLKERFPDAINKYNPNLYEFTASLCLSDLAMHNFNGLDEHNAGKATRIIAKHLKRLTDDKKVVMAAAQHIVNELMAVGNNAE